ncbi:MAG: hypothetical protein CL766_02735 [Chloroflexi bacterium]|nr:hypothetical protein [Chloroflexota bacterium]MCH2304143.1 heme lyase CcmF/NrfE family subunit [SAR202 cluster bacterium]|tara:strand:- start:15417 stop:17381 length:1965 start_codon:yes stop_codon:yes gene_type:complete
MVEIGNISILIALIVSIYCSVVSFLGAKFKLSDLMISTRYGLYSVPLILLISIISIIYAFVTHDFSVQYVYENSNLSMPSSYTWVALYAGNAGSLLFITFLLSVLSVCGVISIRNKLEYALPYTVCILSILLTFFIFVILVFANPFDRLEMIPTDGLGINPLLVHFGMFIHPPVQMTGLISVSIPFAIIMGVVLSGKGSDDNWVDIGRVWGMISWLMLTIGLMLGSWWAYTILGWGGYWAWDPVENSGLMPWLAMTAFIHSIMVQKYRGMFRMWNVILVVLGFTLAQLGMFINRGGPVPSVHSFAASTLGWLFLFFMIATLVSSIVVIFIFRKQLPSDRKLDSIISKESIFLSQNILFLLIAFFTLWGTIYPVFSESVSGETVTVGKPYFDLVNGPLFLMIIFLMSIGPIIPWRKTSFNQLINILKIPSFGFIICIFFLFILGIRNPLALIGFSICSLVIINLLQEWIRGVRLRHRGGDQYFFAFFKLLWANRPRYGGYIVHIGIVMFSVGVIGSSFYSSQKDFSMSPGDSNTFGGYNFKYIDYTNEDYPDRDESIAYFQVESNGKSIGVLTPFRAFYPQFRIAATRGAIKSTPKEDFYIVPSQFEDDGSGVFRVLINPMIWWMWVSAPVIIFGTLFSLFPYRRKAKNSVQFTE